MTHRPVEVAIVDHSLGNLFSVLQACSAVGISAVVTADPQAILNSKAIIIPGVGAFPDAMETLSRRSLIEPIRSFAETGRPVIGICLGFQLLCSSSEEFGHHEGLGLLPGHARRFSDASVIDEKRLRIPQVGWNRLEVPQRSDGIHWNGTLLEGLDNGDHMYFVHSYFVTPAHSHHVLAESRYGGIRYCSAARDANVTGLQFHPERSGHKGLRVYRNLASTIRGVPNG